MSALAKSRGIAGRFAICLFRNYRNLKNTKFDYDKRKWPFADRKRVLNSTYLQPQSRFSGSKSTCRGISCHGYLFISDIATTSKVRIIGWVVLQR